MQAFPHARVTCCFYHFSQSLWRKVQELGWTRRYGTDPVFAHKIRLFSALAFVPTEHVIEAWLALTDYLDEDYDDFVVYFEPTYIGTLRGRAGARRRPIFARPKVERLRTHHG